MAGCVGGWSGRRGFRKEISHLKNAVYCQKKKRTTTLTNYWPLFIFTLQNNSQEQVFLVLFYFFLPFLHSPKCLLKQRKTKQFSKEWRIATIWAIDITKRNDIFTLDLLMQEDRQKWSGKKSVRLRDTKVLFHWSN